MWKEIERLGLIFDKYKRKSGYTLQAQVVYICHSSECGSEQ